MDCIVPILQMTKNHRLGEMERTAGGESDGTWVWDLGLLGPGFQCLSYFEVDYPGVFRLICMVPFDRFPFLLVSASQQIKQIKGLPTAPRLDCCKEHTWVLLVSSFSSLPPPPWTFQLHHLWKSPPFPSSNPHPLKSSHSPLAVGPPIAAQQQESPSARGRRGHGAQHAGKPCRVLLLHFLPRSPREHRRRPPARLCAARPGSASLPFLPEAETARGTHLCSSRVTASRRRGLLRPQDLRAWRTPMGRSKWSGTPAL